MALKKVTAINKIFPSGEKNIGVAIEFEEEIDARSITKDSFRIKQREITGVHLEQSFAGKKGNYIILDLDENSKKAETRKMVGFGPNTKTKVLGANVAVIQKKILMAKDGSSIRKEIRAVKNTEQYNPDLCGFQQMVFKTKDGKELVYHLYVPSRKPGDEKKEFPLVLFMADSSVVSKDSTAPLIQGMGGVVWALPEEQAKRPCYVLVPAYRQKTAFDDFTVTWECEATVQLLQDVVKQYPVDRSRVYGTGQSMGCMMLYEMMSTHPNLFAAGYMVAGQWNPEKIAGLGNQNLWILISEKDEKAFPIITESMKMMEENGTKIARGHLDAKANGAEKSKFVNEVLAQNARIQFTWYEDGSNLPDGISPFPGCYHIFTWLWAYGIEPVREWLFSQTQK